MALLVTAVGFLTSAFGGIAWLIALGRLYDIGWLKSLAIAFVIMDYREPCQLLPAHLTLEA